MYDGINLGCGNLTSAGLGFLALSPEAFDTAMRSLPSEGLAFLFLEGSPPINVFAADLVARTSKPSLNA